MALTDLLGKNWEGTKNIAKARISNFFKGNVPKYSATVLPLVVSQLFNSTPIYAQDLEYDNEPSEEYKEVTSRYDFALRTFQEDLTEVREATNDIKKTIITENGMSLVEKSLLVRHLANVIYSRPEEQKLVNFEINTLKEIGLTKGIKPQILVDVAENLNICLKNYTAGLKNQETYSKLEDTFMELLPIMGPAIRSRENWFPKPVEGESFEGEFSGTAYVPAINMIEAILKHSKRYNNIETNENKVNKTNLQKLENFMKEEWIGLYILRGLSATECCPIEDKHNLINIIVDYANAPGADEVLIQVSPYIPKIIFEESPSKEKRDMFFREIIDNISDDYGECSEGPLEVLTRIAITDYSPYDVNATVGLCRILAEQVSELKSYEPTLQSIQRIPYSEGKINYLLDGMSRILERTQDEIPTEIKDYVKNVALGKQYEGEESKEIKNKAKEIYERYK